MSCSLKLTRLLNAYFLAAQIFCEQKCFRTAKLGNPNLILDRLNTGIGPKPDYSRRAIVVHACHVVAS